MMPSPRRQKIIHNNSKDQTYITGTENSINVKSYFLPFYYEVYYHTSHFNFII